MTRFLACCLLLLSCLLARPAISQALLYPPLPKVEVGVYRLEAGDVVRGPLIGLDTATYRSTMNYVSGAKVLLGVRAERITELERARQLADSTAAVAAVEVRRCRKQAEAGEAEFQALLSEARTLAGKPPERPLLLDGHFYKGVATGGGAAAVLAALLKVFVFKH